MSCGPRKCSLSAPCAAPSNGVVVDRLLVPGEYRNDQSPILTLAQINPLRVEVFVPTRYYGRIHVGIPGEVKPEPPVGGRYAAAVAVVDRVLDAASDTFGVRLELPNPELRLPAGIRCKVAFQMQSAISDEIAAQAPSVSATSQ